jgi:hypothetical protein
VQDDLVVPKPVEFQPLNVRDNILNVEFLAEDAEAKHKHRVRPIDALEAVIAALVGINDIVAEFGHTGAKSG